jgi:hypothetical protein
MARDEMVETTFECLDDDDIDWEDAWNDEIDDEDCEF